MDKTATHIRFRVSAAASKRSYMAENEVVRIHKADVFRQPRVFGIPRGATPHSSGESPSYSHNRSRTSHIAGEPSVDRVDEYQFNRSNTVL